MPTGAFAPGQDISENGCSVAIEHAELALERIYSIKFASLEMQAGFIASSADRKAGTEFLSPLYSAVVDDVVQRFPPPSAAAV